MSDHSFAKRIEDLEADNARLRHLLAQQGVGVELRHQVRNTFAMLRAIIRRSAEIDEAAEDYAAHLEARLDAILRVQNILVRGPVEGAGLYSLLSCQLLAFLAQDGKQVRIEGPDLHLLPRAAEPLSLAFHELAMNAMKFGALGVAEGHIDITWSVIDAGGTVPVVEFTWQESSGPAIETIPARRGFGTELLERMLGYQLNAETELAFEPGGLRCRIRFPLPHDAGSVRVPRHETLEEASFAG